MRRSPTASRYDSTAYSSPPSSWKAQRTRPATRPVAANPAFAHLGPDEGGKLYTEVAGDYYLPEPARLDDTQRAKLRDLGWADPVADLSGDDEIQPRNHTRS